MAKSRLPPSESAARSAGLPLRSTNTQTPAGARAATSWQALRDPDNPENSAAGNRSDWLKHTIWLSGLNTLYATTGHLKKKLVPIHLHSCHAGRGMYRIPADARRAPLEKLWQPTSSPLLLQCAQRAICHSLNVNRGAIDWYAGSALLCQWWRQQHPSLQSTHQLYEWHPDTRAVLAGTLAQLYPELADRTQLVFQDTHGAGRFDGESHIAAALPNWPTNSVLLLDPFALWQHPKHAERRQRFVRIFEGLRAAGSSAPAVSLFFAWSSSRQGDALDGPANRSPHYQQLRQLALQGSHALLEIHWQWDLHCSMWWLLPQHEPEMAARVTQQIGEQLRLLIERFTPPGLADDGRPARWDWQLSGADLRG